MRNGRRTKDRLRKLRLRYSLCRFFTDHRRCACQLRFGGERGSNPSYLGHLSTTSFCESKGSNYPMANNDDKANWSNAATQQLITYLHNYALENGTRQPDKKEWELWISDLSPHFNFPLTVAQLKGKRERLKKIYDTFQALKNNTGLGWDPVAQTVTCSYEYWMDYVKKHPKAKNFRNGGLANEDMLEVIFGRGHANGSMAFGLGSVDVPRRSQVEQENLVDDSIPLEYSDGDSPPHQSTEYDIPQNSRSGPSIANTSRVIGKKSGKSKRKSHSERALDCLNLIAESMSAGTSSKEARPSKELSQEATGRTLKQQCQNILHEMKVDDNLYNLALDGFMANADWPEFFVNMEPHRRLTWIYYKLYSTPPPTNNLSPTHVPTNSNDQPYYSDTRRYF